MSDITKVYARYTGDGSAYLGGVPARNLTADEWAALTDDQRDACLATGLYEVTGGKKAEGKAHEAAAPASQPTSKEK